MVPGEVSLETLRVSQAVWMGQTLMLISSMEAFPQPRQRKQLFSIAAEVPPGEASVPCVADGSFNKSRFWHFRVCSSADTKPGMDSLSGLQTQVGLDPCGGFCYIDFLGYSEVVRKNDSHGSTLEACCQG